MVAFAAGPAVRALVVEHHPALAAEVLALEVPAVEVERVAMHEHDGRLAGVRRRGATVGRHLVELDMQLHAVLGDHGDRGRVQAAENLRAPGPGPSGPHHASFDHDAGRHGGCRSQPDPGEGAEQPSRPHTYLLLIRPPTPATIS
jgi:hypothetical protein